MRQHIILLVLGVLILQTGISLEVLTPRVAVIGGGIGGASASHFLTELFKGSVQIDLYEAKTIGGRLKTVKIDEDEFEAGGFVIHPKNKYMQRFADLLLLERTSPIVKIYSEHYGLWNGESLYLNGDLETMLEKFFISYGTQPYEVKRYAEQLMEDFKKIYNLQDAGQSFNSVPALLSAINKDLPKLLRISTRHYLLHMRFKVKLINELVQAATVVNYGQEVDIQSFAGLTSVSMANVDLWSVKGGNKKIPELLIYRNKNVNVVRGRVTKIRFLASSHYLSQYKVTYLNEGSKDPMTYIYDIVIIAAPLTRDHKFPIKFIGFPDKLVFSGNYQTTYVTFVKTDLESDLESERLPQDTVNIFSCNFNKTKISLIYKADTVNQIKENSRVWKIYSREPIEINRINRMFSPVKIIKKKEIAWKAYPRYSTNMNFDKFKLHHALYHVNAIEWAASTMEMSAIAGRNVALLAYQNFLRRSYDFMLKKEASKNSTKNLRMTGEL